jgi:hypothetical protein
MKVNYKQIIKFIEDCKFLGQDGIKEPNYKEIVQDIMKQARDIDTRNIEPKKYLIATGGDFINAIDNNETAKELAEMIEDGNGEIFEIDMADKIFTIFDQVGFNHYNLMTSEEVAEINKFL